MESTPSKTEEKTGRYAEGETSESECVITKGEGRLVATQDSEEADDFVAGEIVSGVVVGELETGYAFSRIEAGRAMGINLM
jgi:hypothetical protein